MEENNQNIQVEQNENGGMNTNSANVQKPSKMALIICTILCVVFVGISLIYFLQSNSLEGWENILILWTFPIIVGCNIFATLFSIINFAIAFKKSKAQRIFALIMMILVIIYSVFSVVFFYIK